MNVLTKNGINWLSVYDLSVQGINWSDVNVLTRQNGMNWLSVYDLSTRGINWSDVNVLSKKRHRLAIGL